MIRQHQLHSEFSATHGNCPAWDYGGGHGPNYSDTYVKWLEDLVVKLRTRPDLAPYAGDELELPSTPEV